MSERQQYVASLIGDLATRFPGHTPEEYQELYDGVMDACAEDDRNPAVIAERKRASDRMSEAAQRFNAYRDEIYCDLLGAQ